MNCRPEFTRTEKCLHFNAIEDDCHYDRAITNPDSQSSAAHIEESLIAASSSPDLVQNIQS